MWDDWRASKGRRLTMETWNVEGRFGAATLDDSSIDLIEKVTPIGLLEWFWCVSEAPGRSGKVREGPGQKLKKVKKLHFFRSVNDFRQFSKV